ncbi:MAG: heme lyase CcmF/NrfE family subunit [Rickettsiales bacterium]|jgi:cytochrome c-type biogenesis protein CcmF|nr:heme lyase CcmF/NrfE family subunit [Rickettsiales bacterium]
MIAEIALFLTVVALVVSLISPQAILAKRFVILLPAIALAQAMALTFALLLLMMLRIQNDFSVENVLSHSNLSMPLLYKITGTWGNHEGSMLLWAWVMAMFGWWLAFQRSSDEQTNQIRDLALIVQSILLAGVLIFILFTSNPFVRIFPPPPDGLALNPLLQDIALAMHPPMLYLGYVGFSVVFSLAVALMLLPEKQSVDMRRWAQMAHPWIMVSWATLTLGIGLGSWWAYRELGWGGWWFWDPVENASLMPWLSATALLHSNLVLKKRGLLAPWVVLLAILTFGLSLLGTFLVRSGALTSVHSFANDPARGLYILAYIAVVMGAALALYALRGQRLQASETMAPVSREGMIVINNLFILTACATVVLGTMYPLVAEWISGARLTVGAPYFNATFLPIMSIALLFAALVPFMPWKKANIRESLKRCRPALLAAMVAVVLVLVSVSSHVPYAVFGFGLSVWLFVGSLKWLKQSSNVDGRWAVFLGHAGAAIMVAGITGASLWKVNIERSLAVGESVEIGGYTMTLDKIEDLRMPNYSAIRGHISANYGSNEAVIKLYPEYRTYDIRGATTSEASLYGTFFYDLYVVAGEKQQDGKLALRAYYVPMISFIWIGFVLIGMAGFISLRRNYP